MPVALVTEPASPLALALLSLPVAGYGAARLAGAVAGRASDRVAAATRLRRANRVLQAAVAAAGLWAVTESPYDDALAVAVPGPDALQALVALVATVAVGGVLPALAVHLGTRPANAAIVGHRPDYAGVVRRYLAAAALLTTPAFLVVGGWLLAPDGLFGVLTAAAGALAVVAVLPAVVARFGPVRAPTPAEAAAVPECAAGLRVRVVETGNRPVANALAAGVLPGLRYVFVTDALFATLDPAAASAVVAHEAGHHRRGHVAARFGAVAFALAPLFLAASGLVADLWLSAGLTAALLVASGPAVRWTEFDADAYAAREVGHVAMHRALATLSDAGLLPEERSRLGRLVALHPSVGRRLDRLG